MFSLLPSNNDDPTLFRTLLNRFKKTTVADAATLTAVFAVACLIKYENDDRVSLKTLLHFAFSLFLVQQELQRVMLLHHDFMGVDSQDLESANRLELGEERREGKEWKRKRK